MSIESGAFFVFGIIVGSFVNVLVHRIPTGLSVVTPRSFCPKCSRSINWFDNIPIISFIVLRGKCRHCDSRISYQYPLVELGMGLLFLLTATLLLGERPQDIQPVAQTLTIASVVIFLTLTSALALIDFETLRLPLLLILWTAGLILAIFLTASLLSQSFGRLASAVLGSMVYFLFLFLIHILKPDGMGRGDANLAAVLGLQLGWFGLEYLLVGVFLGFAVGTFWGVGLMVLKRANRKSKMPLGPSLILGSWLSLFFGGEIWSAYLSLSGIFS